MKGVITEFTKDSITFSEEGVEELQVFELGEYVKPEYFREGLASLTVKDNVVSFVKMEGEKEQKETDKSTDKTDKSGWEDDMISFEELLTDAHKKFGDKISIKTEIVRDENGKPLLNVKDKFCVMKARVVIDAGLKIEQVFEGHGDTLAVNVVGSVAEKHWIRMAETRAIVRALRWATNNETVAA